MASRADTVLAVAVGAVVAAAGVAGLLATQRSPAAYDPTTPAGVVQTYLRALADGEPSRAVDLLADTSSCTETDVAQAYLPESFRADLTRDDLEQDIATVQVRLTLGSGDPFGSGWQQTEQFVLMKVDGQWRITGAPWPMGWCPDKVDP